MSDRVTPFFGQISLWLQSALGPIMIQLSYSHYSYIGCPCVQLAAGRMSVYLETVDPNLGTVGSWYHGKGRRLILI